MPGGGWVRDPDRGGIPIPPNVQARTTKRLLAHAEQHFAGKYTRLGIRFKGQFCYIDAYTEPNVLEEWPPAELSHLTETREERIEHLRNTPLHLCRLRYYGNEENWAFAMFGYSDEKYQSTMLPSGDLFGTPEEALRTVGEAYLG